MTTSAPSPVASLTRLDGVARRDVDVLDRPASEHRVRELEPACLALEQEHPLGPLRQRQRGVRGPDRPRADDGHRLAGADAEILVSADRVGERVGEGRVDGVEAVREPEDVLQRDAGHGDELGVRAGVVEAHEAAALAEMLVSPQAEVALAAVESRDHVHDVARSRVQTAVRVRPDLDDLPAGLVPEDPARPDAAVAVVERAHVRAADAAGDDAKERPVPRAGGLRHVRERHLARRLPEGRSHSACGRPRASVLASATCERPTQHDSPQRSSQALTA